ncbi:helix-turn-helix domain-containing protein [Qipengyuania sp. CAU 1752]
MIDLQFFPIPGRWSDHLTSIYRLEVNLPAGKIVSDVLLPEWGNVRFFDDRGRSAGRLAGLTLEDNGFLATGPSARPVRFSIGACRLWGIGLLPLGWATFVRAPARSLVNKAFNGATHPAYAHFTTLSRQLDGAGHDDWKQYRLVCDWLKTHAKHPRDEDRLLAMQNAVMDRFMIQIPDFAERAGVSVRTLERLSLKYFGFSPNVVLRRQRLIRSLTSFMIDGDGNWTQSIDRNYHDQPHFVREFHNFIGMSPTEYAALDHPIMNAFMEHRQKVWGTPVRARDVRANETRAADGLSVTA